MHMNLVRTNLSETEVNTRVLRIQVRIKAILEALLANSDSPQTTGPIFKFLNRLTTPGRFIPSDYLSELEKKRLNLDDRGRIV